MNLTHVYYVLVALVLAYALVSSVTCRRLLGQLIGKVDRVAAASEDMAESLRDIKKSVADRP